MDNGVLLETKTLVELIRHYIRDQVRVRSSKISRHFHCFVVLKIQMVFGSYLKRN
jgi:hypothetical protein